MDIQSANLLIAKFMGAELETTCKYNSVSKTVEQHYGIEFNDYHGKNLSW